MSSTENQSLSEMQIDIVSDAVCPWCLVGKRHLETALAQRPDLQAKIRWRPFQLHPDMPAEGKDRKEAIAAKFGSLENAKQIYDRVSQAGERAGVQFNFDAIERTPNTLNAHRLIHWAGQAGYQDEVVEILFRQFFIDGKDIGLDEVLIACAKEAGMDADDVAARLSTEEDRGDVLEAEQKARQMGVEGVPMFIIGNKYMLSGAQPPDMFLQVFDKLAEEATADTAS